MSAYVVYMAKKPFPMQEKCFRETLFPKQSSNWRILQQWMVMPKDKGIVGGIFREDLQWAVDTVGPLDVACSHIISMWGWVMDTITRTMERNQLYTSSSIETARSETIHTSD